MWWHWDVNRSACHTSDRPSKEASVSMQKCIWRAIEALEAAIQGPRAQNPTGSGRISLKRLTRAVRGSEASHETPEPGVLIGTSGIGQH